MVSGVIMTWSGFSGSTTRTVLCNSVTYSIKKNNEVKPLDNGGSLAYIQTQGYENPKVILQRVFFTGAAGTLTWDDVCALANMKYDNTNAPTIAVTYDGNTQLKSITGATSIKIILDNTDLPINMSESADGSRPELTLNFTETK
jgi:hypothetical protein